MNKFNKNVSASKSNKSDYRSNLQVRWCSGCGDYHILNALSSAWASLNLQTHRVVLVSGIGCSSRLPYYASTYGFHSIHGRAPSVALGIKVANPDLSVWVITGDGDGLSIGANHLVHACRRNLDINILLFNNQIYGLTKGQASPTSTYGLKTVSSPSGVKESAISAISLAIAAGATFVARVVDTHIHDMKDIFTQAYNHKGVSFVEIYTNCVIYNDKAFEKSQKRSSKDDNCVMLKHNEPLIFGKDKNKALTYDGFNPKIISIDNYDDSTKDCLFLHKKDLEDQSYAYSLSQIDGNKYPLPLGVFRQVSKPVFEDNFYSFNRKKSKKNINIIDHISKNKNFRSLDDILKTDNFNRL